MQANPTRLQHAAVLALLSVCATPTHLPAQDPTPLPWSTDVDRALETASTEHKLTLICFNMDGEEANERALQMYRSAEFRKATDNVVLVLCSTDAHAADKEACPRFASCTCREHIASEKQVRRHFFGGLSSTLAPQHLLLYPDGMVAWHAVESVSPDDLFKAIATCDKLKTQSAAQHVRALRNQLALSSSKAARGSLPAYLQVQAMLVQVPAAQFCEALQSVSKDVAERVLKDLAGFDRDRAQALLDAATKHPSKTLRDIAAALAEEVRARPVEKIEAPAPATPATPTGPKPLASPLAVLGAADDFERVQWVGKEHKLADSRGRITVLWFFMLDMPGLASAVARMNAFAAANRGRGIETVGLVATIRTAEAVEKVPTLGLHFPVGVFAAVGGYRPCGVGTFPTWVVLDPETNVVYRTPQDGSSFEWDAATDLALQMLATPSYAAQIKAGSTSK